MSWNDSVTEPTRRPTRSIYIPPYLRTTTSNNTTPFGSQTDFSSGPRFTAPNRGRGHGRGRGRWGQNRQFHDRPTNANPFDLIEKCDELEVVEDGNVGQGINFDAYEDIPVETSGSDIPPAVNTFAEIDLGKALNENIRRCKYVRPTPVQRHAIPIALAGRDLMACAQTGSGKTAAFCFPIISGIMRNPKSMSVPVWGGRGGGGVAYPLALILSPTRELSCQIHEEAKKFSYQTGVKIVVAYGGAPISQQLRNLEKGVDILVATPGRLVDMIERERVSLRMIKFLALDEADRMLDMGFEPQIRRIVEQMGMPRPGPRQTMLFSATFPTDIQLALTLVFVETKRGADTLEHWLCMNGFPAAAIHGDKVQMERERALKSFKTGVTPVLVATDVAARGLDIPHVAHVVNFDLPKDIDDYVHRIGRTGRAGKSGLATAFFSDKNLPLAKSLVELMVEAKQEVPPWLTQYAESSSAYGSSGRGRRYGSGKFGGRDYRNSSKYNSGDDYNYTQYADSYAVSDSYAAATSSAFPYDATPNSAYYAGGGIDSNAVGSHGYNFDQEGIVASGWD
ncbi:hypothetical protein RHMOL_Rhmol01G0066800 [Rhododendron molle]|uniref:Uncharacterized protein n=1 Tax=Rhododendron molle TaxID=49168 RepID=A0ACC0PZC3_RHOML|nr:hypothetical protein RHMOL_Rhmol01G0066800 [Rhododendron molle]